ncbi:nickel ABC transporter permease [Maridesulfovibrio sp.]|uniref:nickel/cobalt transporter n=1 Tax=Maridesulfovibrio sp. TaxID=2795000 RepID=UPI002A18B9F1|nr:nickel ABC transporter permease [Maridesulfovibrio sp.]
MNKILPSILLSVAVLLLLLSGLAYAGGDSNPFLTPKKETSASAGTGDRAGNSEIRVNIRTETAGSFYTALMTRITMAQKEIRDRLTGFSTEIRKNHFGKSFWLFLAFTFAYGAVHALGPGHGKSVVCAYFISRPGSILTAAFMSWLISVVHVGSATVTVCLAYLLLKNGMSGFENFNNHMQTASFLLIAAIGLWMTVEAVFSFRGRNCNCSNARGATLKETAAVAFVTGIIPCPGAAIILVYTLSAGILRPDLRQWSAWQPGWALPHPFLPSRQPAPAGQWSEQTFPVKSKTLIRSCPCSADW